MAKINYEVLSSKWISVSTMQVCATRLGTEEVTLGHSPSLTYASARIKSELQEMFVWKTQDIPKLSVKDWHQPNLSTGWTKSGLCTSNQWSSSARKLRMLTWINHTEIEAGGKNEIRNILSCDEPSRGWMSVPETLLANTANPPGPSGSSSSGSCHRTHGWTAGCTSCQWPTWSPSCKHLYGEDKKIN